MDPEQIQSQPGSDGFNDNFARCKPVLPFATVQHQLERTHPDGQGREAGPVELQLGPYRALRHEQRQPGHRQHAERQVHVKHPAPVIVLGQPATDRGPQDRPNHHANAEDRHRLRALFHGVGVKHRRLR